MKSVFAATAFFLWPVTAFSQTSAVADRLPEELFKMKQMERTDGENGRVTAHYGEAIGRATVVVQPTSGNATETGVTDEAQVAMLQATAQNIAAGTRALGDDYETAVVDTQTLTVDATHMICGKIERRQGEGVARSERMSLLDQWCFSQIDGALVGIHITTPYRGRAMGRDITEKQVTFVGVMAKTLQEGENPK